MQIFKPTTAMTAMALLLLGSAGCASAPPPKKAEKKITRTTEKIDLSGKWNDVDSDAIATAMIKDCMSFPWAEEWKVKTGRKPVIRLFPIKNKTDGYIDYRYFTKQLEASLLRSGRVEVVSSLEEASAAREERKDQAKHASDETAKSQGNETASDFILTGWILSSNDEAAGKEVKSYLTSLELVETETQKKAWVGQKKIKKLIESRPAE